MDLVVEFFRHNTLMNQRLVEACRPLTADQLHANAVGTFGSIAATLVHVANSQVSYAADVLDTARLEPLPVDTLDLEAVADRLAYGNAQLEVAAEQAGSEREIQVSGDDPPGTWRIRASLVLLQAINHGTDHRSQVATMLTQFGVEPPDMGGWPFFMDSGHMIPV